MRGKTSNETVRGRNFDAAYLTLRWCDMRIYKLSKPNQTHILLRRSEFLRVAEHALLLAFLGHVVSKGEIEFDASNNLLSVHDSTCSTDKTIYSTIVVASISLLVFFIASQVIEKETTKAKDATMTTAFCNTRKLRVHA